MLKTIVNFLYSLVSCFLGLVGVKLPKFNSVADAKAFNKALDAIVLKDNANEIYQGIIFKIRQVKFDGKEAVIIWLSMYESSFTRAYLTVCSREGRKLEISDEGAYIIRDFFIVNFDRENGKEVYKYLEILNTGDKLFIESSSITDEVEDDVFCCLEIGNGEKQIDLELSKDDAETAIPIGNSASGCKKGASLYAPNTPFVKDILSVATSGASDKMFGKTASRKEAVKKGVRIYQCLAPSKVGDTYQNFAIYGNIFGEGTFRSLFSKETILEALEDIIDEEGNVTALDTFKELVERANIEIVIEDAYNIYDEHGDIKKEILGISELCLIKGTGDGLGIDNRRDLKYRATGKDQRKQGRPATAKGFIWSMLQKSVDTLVNTLDANPIIIHVNQLTTEEERNIDMLFEKNCKDSPYYKRLIIFINNDDEGVELVGDLNFFKASWDYTKEMEVPVMALPKSSGCCNLSKQSATKLLKMNYQNGCQLITELALEYFQEEVFKSFDLCEPLKTGDLNSFYLPTAIKKGLKPYMAVDKSLFDDYMRDILKKIEKAINKLQFPIKGSANTRALADPGLFFGIRILEEDEIFFTGTKAKQVIGQRFPGLNPGAEKMYKNVSYKQVKHRISKLLCSQDIKAFILDGFNIDKTCCIMSASPVNMVIHDGMDYDFDALRIVWNEKIIAFYNKYAERYYSEMVVTVNKADVASNNYLFDLDTLFNPTKANLTSGKVDVGPLTINAEVSLELLGIIEPLIGSTNPKHEKALELQVRLAYDCMDLAFANEKRDKFGKRIQPVTSKFTKKVIPEVTFSDKESLNTKVDLSIRIPNFDLGIRKSGKEYLPLERQWAENICRVVIDQNTKEARRNQMMTCERTLDNLIKILKDAASIASSDQNVVIDSDKTGINGQNLFNFTNAGVRLFSRVPYTYTMKGNSIVRNEISLGSGIYLNDRFSRIRVNLERVLIAECMKYVEQFMQTRESNNALIMRALDAVLANEKYRECAKEITAISSSYSNVASALINLPDVAIEYSNTYKEDYYNGLQYMVLKTFEKYDICNIQARAGIMFFASCYSIGYNGSLRPKLTEAKDDDQERVFVRKSMFDVKVCAPYAYKNAIKFCNIMKMNNKCTPYTQERLAWGDIEDNTKVKVVKGVVIDQSTNTIVGLLKDLTTVDNATIKDNCVVCNFEELIDFEILNDTHTFTITINAKDNSNTSISLYDTLHKVEGKKCLYTEDNEPIKLSIASSMTFNLLDKEEYEVIHILENTDFNGNKIYSLLLSEVAGSRQLKEVIYDKKQKQYVPTNSIVFETTKEEEEVNNTLDDFDLDNYDDDEDDDDYTTDYDDDDEDEGVYIDFDEDDDPLAF